MIDAKAMAKAFEARGADVAARGQGEAAREARALAATWATRAAVLGWSKRKLNRLGLSPEAVATLTGARAACGDVAAELIAAELRLAELA